MGKLVTCVLKASELDAEPIDVILFPEGVNASELEIAGDMHPESVIVAAVEEGVNCRAIMCYNGLNYVSYLKVRTDGRTQGTGDLMQIPPVARLKGMCLGMLVCMDVDYPLFSQRVLNALRACSEPTKLLCIPADMSNDWFEGDTLAFPTRFEGIHVALCNHTKTHNARCRSFIADTFGKKVQVQKDCEPIYGRLL